MGNLNSKPAQLSARITATLLLFAIATAVFAVDGIVIRSKASKSSFSNMKKNITLSLNTGFNYRDNKSFGFKKAGASNSFNTVITFQKGNIKYVIPYKHKTILQKFKTPEKPQQ
jgi:hypothetical protein